MPVNPKNLDEVNKKLKEATEKISQLEAGIKKVNQEAVSSGFAFLDMSKSIGTIAAKSEEFQKQIAATGKTAKSLTTEASKLAGFTKEDLKDKKKMASFQKAAEKVLKKRQEIEAQIATLNLQKVNASKKDKDAISKTVEVLQDGLRESEGMVDNFDKLAKTNTKLNKSTKFFDKLEGTLKTIPGLGPLIAGPFTKASKAVREARVEGDGFLKSTGKGVLELGKAFGPAFFLGAMIKANKHTVELGRSLQMSVHETEEMEWQFSMIAINSGKAYMHQKNLAEAMKGLAKETGVTTGFSEDQLKNQVFLTKQLGLSEKSAAKFAKYQISTGKSAKETNEEIADQVVNLKKETGISLKLSDVMEGVADVNAGLKAAYGFNNKLLAEQVIKTKQLGISMSQAENIAKGMLDFESSIANEMSAELLTGKSLNLEEARRLALMGKSSEAAGEILKQVGSSKDLAKMNVIQQEALAKAVGMERNELIASVKEKELLNKIGGRSVKEQLEGAKTEAERLAIKKRIKAQGGEDLLQQYETTSAAEKFEAVMVKIQGVIANIGSRLSPIIDMFAAILDTSGGIWTILGLISTVALASMVSKGYEIYQNLAKMFGVEQAITGQKQLQVVEETVLNTEKVVGVGLSAEEKVLETGNLFIKKASNTQEKIGIGLALRNVAISGWELIKSIGSAVMAAVESMSSIPVIGPFLGLAVGATIGALGMKYMSDGVIGPDGEMVVSGPKGSIQLDKEDSIIAGTNLGGKGNKTTTPPERGGGARRDAALITKIEQLISVNKQILAKSPVIEMAGNEVGQGINQDERSIQ